MLKMNKVFFCLLITTNIIAQTPGSGVTDIDGNQYATVIIGTQEIMSENLRTTNYRNGDPIPTELNDETWGSTTSGAYAIYDNDNANDAIYGKLYNWYAVADARNMCPIGWHLPTDGEWTTLIEYLGGEGVAGGKMKTTGTQYWLTPNTDATNESGFTGLPGGVRLYFVGIFNGVGTGGLWWSSSEFSAASAWYCELSWNGGSAARNNIAKQNGFSVRCLRD